MEPTEGEWRRLYAAAVQFRDLAPWDWMWDSALFGVQDPESDTIGYCCVMGNAGEHFALALYLGTGGLIGLWKLRELWGGPFTDPMEVLATQHCLMASFEDRQLLNKRDLDTIKALGLKFRGRNAWPQFRSYQPGYDPWYLTAPEARFLATALEQAVEVAGRLSENPRLLPVPEPSPKDKYLVRVLEQTASGPQWRDTQQTPAPVPTDLPAPHLEQSDQDRARHLGETLPRTDGVLELDFFPMPQAVQDARNERPYFPTIILLADERSQMILGTEMTRSNDVTSAAVRKLLEVSEQLGGLPARVTVQRPEVEAMLAPVTKLLRVPLKRVRRLKAIATARGELCEFLGL